MTILFWDIDGTLLTTGKAGVPAWETAVREIIGRDFELARFRIAGLTDYQIAAKTFELLGADSGDGRLQQMLTRYEDGLPEALPKKQGHVMPHVREILDRLVDRSDVRSYLLTGNTRRGATAKLTHYDLMKYFPDGGFAEDTQSRSTIAARALELARRTGAVDLERVFVIGDTPHDVECANAIGVKTIAVATGGYTLEELAEHNPWRVLPQLPPPDEFFRLIGIGPTPDRRSPTAAVTA